MAERYYSVADANALLAELRPILERIREYQAGLAEDKTVAVLRRKASQNGGGAAAQQLAKKARGLERDLEQLNQWGILLRDPETGLVDFFHKREGQTVFLCWRLGEAAVEWWHPIETGIAGRQRL